MDGGWVYQLTPEEKIIKAKTYLLKYFPFFGYALAQIPIVNKEEVKRRGPPGKRWIEYDEDFVDKLKVEEVAGVLAHELLHFLLRHVERTKHLKKLLKHGGHEERKYYSLMNIAQDIVVNAILVKNGLKLPGYAYVPSKTYDGRTVITLSDHRGNTVTIEDVESKTSEEIYWEIKDLELIWNEGDEGTMSFNELDDDISDNVGSEGELNGETENGSANGSESGEGCEQDQSDLENPFSSGGGNGGEEDEDRYPFNPDSLKSPEEILVEAYTYSKIYGLEPLGIDRHIELSLKPVVDWKAQLRKFVSKEIPTNYSFLKPSKKSTDNVILPGIIRERGRLKGIVVIDTSGSITPTMLSQFMSEIEWIARNYMIDLLVMTCDAKVHTIDRIRSVKALEELALKGGGGTDFTPAFEAANKLNPKFMIYFTDGYGVFPERPPRYPVLWVVPEGCLPDDKFPFGKVVRIRGVRF